MGHAGRLFALVALVAAVGSSTNFDRYKADGKINDFAHILDPSTLAQLDHYVEQVSQVTGAKIWIVTVPSLEGMRVAEFAEALFDRWGLGKSDGDETVMLLLSVHERRSFVQVAYPLRPELPETATDAVLREMRAPLRERDFPQALISGVAEIGSHIATAQGIALTRTLPRRGPPPDDGDSISWLFIVAGIALLFAFIGRRKGGSGFLTGILMGNLLGPSRWRGGGWRGGGFGGSAL